MTYDEFVKQVSNNFMHETIYKDSEGRSILVISLLDAYYMMSVLSKREWVDLTDDEINHTPFSFTMINGPGDALLPFARAVMAKLKEKNNG